MEGNTLRAGCQERAIWAIATKTKRLAANKFARVNIAV